MAGGADRAVRHRRRRRRDHLTGRPDVIALHSDGRWPVEDFTLADDLRLVAQHQADHENHRAFTFTVLTPSRTDGLGCVHLNPLHERLRDVGADPQVLAGIPLASAMVTFWLRQDKQDTGLADAVAAAVDDWLLDEWPLDTWFFRVLPGERCSRAALGRLGVESIDLAFPGEPRPHLWYRTTR